MAGPSWERSICEWGLLRCCTALQYSASNGGVVQLGGHCLRSLPSEASRLKFSFRRTGDVDIPSVDMSPETTWYPLGFSPSVIEHSVFLNWLLGRSQRMGQCQQCRTAGLGSLTEISAVIFLGIKKTYFQGDGDEAEQCSHPT
jgi:hypothetical protein